MAAPRQVCRHASAREEEQATQTRPRDSNADGVWRGRVVGAASVARYTHTHTASSPYMCMYLGPLKSWSSDRHKCQTHSHISFLRYIILTRFCCTLGLTSGAAQVRETRGNNAYGSIAAIGARAEPRVRHTGDETPRTRTPRCP